MWFELKGDARLGRCATERCGGQPTSRLESDGIGSNYCSGCRAKIEGTEMTGQKARMTMAQMQARDGDEMAARRLADLMLSMLRDYIPENSRRDAWELMAKSALDQGFELTSKAMRKEYEAWKNTQLDVLNHGLGAFMTKPDGSIVHISPKDLAADGDA